MTAKSRKRTTTPARAREETVAEPPPADFCDNHPDVPAVLVTSFPWTLPQKFCRPCVPAQYAYLL